MKGYRVGLIAEGFLDTAIRHHGWEARPLTVSDRTREQAVEAWAKSLNASVLGWNAGSGPNAVALDLIALDAAFQAESAEDAVSKARPAMDAFFRAIRFRQMGSGRVIAVVAFSVDDPSDASAVFDFRRRARIRHRVEGKPDWDRAGEIVGMFNAIEGSPVGRLLTDLFADALGDSSREGAIARLWSILEIMSEGFKPARPTLRGRLHAALTRRKVRHPRGKLAQVVAAMDRLSLGSHLDYRLAYRIRNAFVHEGRRATDEKQAERIRVLLIQAVFLALVRSGFTPVNPSAAAFEAPPDMPVRRVDFEDPGPG